MSLPGLQLLGPPEPVVASTVHELNPNTEWRFETALGIHVEVKLLSGTAEIFGTELAIKQAYTFSGTKAAIYTWHGCRIEVIGECLVEYIAEENPMISYANTHFALDQLREKATLEGREGPRVMVLGPENAGKTSLVKILTAYAIRTGRQPVVVNLDTKEGMLSIPGSLSASAFSSIIDVEEGWGSSPMNGPSQVPVKLPLVYYYGLASPEENTKIFKPVTTRLALSVMSRLQEDQEAKEAGCIVDTSGVISQGKGGYEIIQHIVSEFSINVVIILGSERLSSDMVRRFNGQKTSMDDIITVIKLDKSGGCVDRDEAYLKQFRQAQIREYFFGDPKITLSPHTQQVDFNQVIIYRAAESNAVLNSLLPGGETEDATVPSIFDKIQPSSAMQNGILAIVHADPNDSQENIRDASVIGFVYVAEVDEKKKKLRVLAPLSGRLPNRAMIWGSWPDSIGDLVG
ncbi:Cleavage polyadenylation factor subunit clp1 [Hypocenomyce scalaris]|nr:Cleavage polyadenylation factor subunit clp1 [Hypocenomyce scalaris]